MEILIVGFIIVALMAYVSTKIKKAAREAYEQETFENEYYRITKPNDFIIPVKEGSESKFETYSKEFGEDEADKLNQCRATVNEKDGVKYDPAVLETERVEQNITVKTVSKTLVNKELNKSFELEISVLADYEEKFADAIKLMLDSFSLK